MTNGDNSADVFSPGYRADDDPDEDLDDEDDDDEFQEWDEDGDGDDEDDDEDDEEEEETWQVGGSGGAAKGWPKLDFGR